MTGLISDHLLLSRPHMLGVGVQRIYRFPCGAGVSLVNAPILHSYRFAWEAAVLADVDDQGDFGQLDYSTPLTSDVEVFSTDDEANDFIRKAADHFASRPKAREAAQ